MQGLVNLAVSLALDTVSRQAVEDFQVAGHLALSMRLPLAFLSLQPIVVPVVIDAIEHLSKFPGAHFLYKSSAKYRAPRDKRLQTRKALHSGRTYNGSSRVVGGWVPEPAAAGSFYKLSLPAPREPVLNLGSKNFYWDCVPGPLGFLRNLDQPTASLNPRDRCPAYFQPRVPYVVIEVGILKRLFVEPGQQGLGVQVLYRNLQKSLGYVVVGQQERTLEEPN